ncbi:MAG: Transglutaminase-like enzyme putative cysteine protease [Polyangiaceae bacterium]|jgi:transglutaminase-like putative cysteine protease|nr:Transglutaminase-like enzyme putative cysteine protease [Polyangiaceae bacterium]
MSGKRLWWCGVLGGLGLAVGCARTVVPEYPPVMRAPREVSTEEAPVRFLDVRLEYVFDDQGNWREHLRQRYRILNQQGVETWGGTAAGWSPWYMARPELEAQVQDPGGALRKLDLASVAEAPAYPELPDIYGDRRVLRAPLPGVHVGSIVTEATRRWTTRPFFPGGSAFQVTIQNAIPRDAMELVVDLPSSLPFNYELLDARVKKEETLGGGRRHVVFRAKKLEGIEPAEAFSPSTVPQWPAVAFSTGESWQRIAAEYEAVMNAKLRGAEGVAELARRTVTSGASARGKANQLLYALHQRVRYVAVEFGQSAIVPASPAEVLRRTYGDCKDQALVLVAMLRAVGLPATLALLRAGPGEDVRPRLPALDVFNHAIVVVQTDEPFWIDPTSNHARAGELPESDQGRLALIVDAKSRALVRTPSLGAEHNGYLEVREIRLQEGGPTRVSEASSGTGVIEQRLRDSFAASDAERESSLSEYVKKQYSADELLTARFDGLDDVQKPLRLTLAAEGEKVVSFELFRAVVPVDYGLLTSWLPEPVWNDKPRRGNLRLPLRYRAEVRYRVVPPPHFRARRLPVLPELALGPARLTRRYVAEADGAVTGIFKFEIDQDQLTPGELAQLKDGLSALGSEEKDEIELVHEAELSFADNRPREGMRLLQELAGKDTTRASSLLRLATKLSELGFGKQAREKARLAAEREPKSALSHRTLGLILQRDEQGRLRTPGADQVGAQASFRRALKLDESDQFSKLWLASLLVTDASEDSLDEAISLYDDVPSETVASYRDGYFAHQGADALLGAHRFEALAERSEQLPAAYVIAAETHRSGGAAGVSYANRNGLVGASRAKALATAAGAFYTARRYPEASVLYEEASRDLPQYAAVARILEVSKPFEPTQLSATSPEGAVRQAELLAVLARPARFDPLTGTRPAPRVVADLHAATLRTSVSGSDSLGFRVHVQSSDLGGRATVFDRYVVKQGASYVVKASTPAELGCEALERVAHHDTRGARQWLAWAADSVESEAGEDPLRSLPFSRLWADGKGDPEVAAAALCATSSKGSAARLLLIKARGIAKAEGSALEHAIALGARAASDHAEQLVASERLLAMHPASFRARELRWEALWALRRFSDVEREARRSLSEAQSRRLRFGFGQWLGRALSQLGKVAEAQRVHRQAVENSEPATLADSYNAAAWASLFVDPRPRDMRELARLAAELSERQSYAALHTLASVLLDLGDVSGAQTAFQQLLDLDASPQLSDGTRYVQGGLAEAYGLPEIAHDLYRSVKPREDGAALSSYALAQRRLAALRR